MKLLYTLSKWAPRGLGLRPYRTYIINEVIVQLASPTPWPKVTPPRAVESWRRIPARGRCFPLEVSLMSKIFEALAALAAVGTFIVTFLDSYEIKFKIRRRARTVRDGKEQRRKRRKK